MSIARIYHPAVVAGYFTIVLGLTMCCIHPLLIAISLMFSLICSCTLLGTSKTSSRFVSQLLFALFIALLNPIISRLGSTVLFKLGPWNIYAESLIFGLCMGGMLLATLQWFSLVGELLDTERLLALIATPFPRLALIIAMVFRLVPETVSRGHESDELSRVALGKQSLPSAQGMLRASNAVANWTLEGTLVAAQSMRARGYGQFGRRTTYERYAFRPLDACVLAVVLLAGIACAVFGWQTTSTFNFYPSITPIQLQLGYAYYGLYLLLPVFVYAREKVRNRG